MAFDFVIIGGGSAGAALAARLSEDPDVTVALIEAGERPPEREQMPIACASLQLDPETDWMFTGDPGKGGLGFKNRRMPVPRGKMLGGSSGINYMVFVRGHPGDFDNWERLGAEVGAIRTSCLASSVWNMCSTQTRQLSVAICAVMPDQLA